MKGKVLINGLGCQITLIPISQNIICNCEKEKGLMENIVVEDYEEDTGLGGDLSGF